jgi:hypothetical protein
MQFLTARRMAAATLVVAVVVALHVRKMYEQSNPDAYQLLNMNSDSES